MRSLMELNAGWKFVDFTKVKKKLLTGHKVGCTSTFIQSKQIKSCTLTIDTLGLGKIEETVIQDSPNNSTANEVVAEMTVIQDSPNNSTANEVVAEMTEVSNNKPDTISNEAYQNIDLDINTDIDKYVNYNRYTYKRKKKTIKYLMNGNNQLLKIIGYG